MDGTPPCASGVAVAGEFEPGGCVVPVHVIANRGEDGRWTLARNGTDLVASPGVTDDELLERIEELVVVGWLDPADRISVADVGHLPAIRRIEQFLELAEWDERRRRDLAEVRAERYASEEHYV